MSVTAAILMSAQTMLYRRVPLEKPPEELAGLARAILHSVGYSEPPMDSAMGFYEGKEFLRYIAEHDNSKTRWDNLETGAFVFWYRSSPRPLAANFSFFFSDAPIQGSVWTDDPPLDESGMTLIQLNPLGGLTRFVAVPPQIDNQAGGPSPPDWVLRCSLPRGSIRRSGQQRSRCGRLPLRATHALLGREPWPSARISRCGLRPQHTGESPSTSS